TAELSRSPTMTAMGVILGTAAYMSPEQARGKLVDRRTDVWAFGCVVYEMVMGKPPFAGQTVTDTLAAIVIKNPDWTSTPAPLRRMLESCLKKDPRQRVRSAADALLLIDEALAPEAVASRASARP